MSSFDNKFDYLKVPLTDILTATNNFADENIIRGDESGNEYIKGRLVLWSGELIDIVARRLDPRFGQGNKEFQQEIIMLSSLDHPNLVTIVGFCDENDEKIIINKFESNGSLDLYLTDPTLTWTQRLQICLGLARALSYIHYDEGRSFSVIHRNIKSSKILLDKNWEAKLSGFELSSMQPSSRRHGLILDRPCGTPGYIDPAYATSSSVTHKSDVYSFGVVLIEVLSGRIASNYNYLYNKNGPVFLATLAKSSYENGTLHDMIHPVIRNQINPQALKIYAEAAYCCLKDQRAQRPHIDRVIVALDQALQLQLAFENSLVSKERPVEGAFITNQWKEKDLEHLKIEFDAIKLATENFAEKYLIGSGGYGVVYKAELEHFDSTAPKRNKKSEPPRRYSTVAIKRILDREDRQGEQGFIVEIDTLSSCMHPNVVSLLGFCHEPPHMILIYEHVSNGSLDDYLGSKGNMTNFSWVQRLKICIDIARGLDYIHATLDNKRKIIHRDIKSANILLGENWEAKIADFGLSKLHPLSRTQSTLNTKHVVGTRVYWDPEYERTGRLKKESDVYSFGVVLFELVTGRLAYDPVYTKENEKGLAPVVRQHFQKGTIREMIDPNLKEESMFTLGKGLNQDSLNRVLLIGHRCLAEKQAERPTMKVVIEELEKALSLQETQKDILQMSFEDIRLATQNFKNQIGEGGFGKIYRGEIIRYNERIPIAVKRHVKKQGQGEKEFLTELEILFEYKHENIIGLLGYCNENNEKIIVYKYASKGSLDKHLKDANLTWMKRLKIGIDAAVGLDFLHGADPPVIHRDIKSSNILLNENWKSKITDFGLSMIAPLNNEIDFMVDDACGTLGYVDPQFAEEGFLTKESDIYSFGVVLFEMLCGRTAFPIKGKRGYLGELVIRHYEEGNILELVFEGIKDQIVRKSLITFLEIAYECLHDEREMRPTANKVALQLKKALKFQEDVEIWAAKLPTDYKEIIKMSKNAEMLYNSNVSNKDLYDMLSKGILLQNGKVCLSIGNNGERNEMVSATMFSYENNILHNKRISIPNSRFQRVVKIMDISNLKIQINIMTQFLSPNVMYGVHFVFKFCDPRKISSKLMYVNLKFHIGDETLHAYFAKQEEDEWMSIELVRFTTQDRMRDMKFPAQLESLSRYYCGNGAIYVEGIHFRAITDTTLKLSSLGKVNRKKCYMLPAKTVLYESNPDVKCFEWNYLVEPETRYAVVAEVLSHQAFRIKCKIKAKKLSRDTNYACYLVFKLSEQCHGLECPVKVQDMLLRKNKAELKYLFFRNPRYEFQHGTGRVPERREDGLMEVIVWELNSRNMKHNDDHDLIPMNLKLRCYEGNMFGLIVYGIEFRPMCT